MSLNSCDEDYTLYIQAAAPGGDVKMTYDGKVGGAGLTLKVGEEEANVACSGQYTLLQLETFCFVYLF